MRQLGEADRPDPSGRSSGDHSLPIDARGERAMHRRVFREMIRVQADQRPLTWSERREHVRFAASLGIDANEAKLLIRAVEYECGHLPPGSSDGAGEFETAYVVNSEPQPIWGPIALGFGLALLAGLAAWIINSVR